MTTLRLELRVHQPVSPIDDSSDELSVLVLGLEVAAAPEYEGLSDGILQTPVSLLYNAVLVRERGLVLVESTP